MFILKILLLHNGCLSIKQYYYTQQELTKKPCKTKTHKNNNNNNIKINRNWIRARYAMVYSTGAANDKI